MKTIAVDVDDVLAVNAKPFMEFSNQRWGGNLTVDDFQEDFAQMWGVDLEEVNRRAEEYISSGIANDYPHFEDAMPVLKELGKRFKLVIVTSRRKGLRDHTIQWLSQRFDDIFEEVHYAGLFDKLDSHKVLHTTKADICRQIGADYLIDDQLKHCAAAAEAGLEAVLFGNYSWNQADELPPRVTRATDWQAVGKYFDAQS